MNNKTWKTTLKLRGRHVLCQRNFKNSPRVNIHLAACHFWESIPSRLTHRVPTETCYLWTIYVSKLCNFISALSHSCLCTYYHHYITHIDITNENFPFHLTAEWRTIWRKKCVLKFSLNARSFNLWQSLYNNLNSMFCDVLTCLDSNFGLADQGVIILWYILFDHYWHGKWAERMLLFPK
jgi:hypothetical protein